MDEREKLKQELLEELKKEYQLLPIKAARFSVMDILEKYHEEICKRIDVPNDWSNRQIIDNAIRKVVSMHFGIANVKDLPIEKRSEYREELEKFIKDYLLKDEQTRTN